MKQFQCQKSDSDATNFTDSKLYRECGRQGNLFAVLDDIGRLRYIIPDVPCPHLCKQMPERWPHTQMVVGKFVEV